MKTNNDNAGSSSWTIKRKLAALAVISASDADGTAATYRTQRYGLARG